MTHVTKWTDSIHSIPITTKTLVAVVASMWASLNLSFAQSGTWNTTTTPSPWETASNWTGNAIADGSGNTANFNALDINTNTTVNLTTPRVIGILNFGDTNPATAASWILSGGINSLTLAGTFPTVSVNGLGTNQATTIKALLAGTSGFTKSGDGKLLLSNSGNTISGVISLSQGTLEYSNSGSLGTSSLSFTGSATLRAGAATTVTRAVDIGSGITATFDTNGLATTQSGALTGSGTLTKTGSGTLTLSGALNNTFSGNIQINAGTLKSWDGTSCKNMTGAITVALGATFYFGQNFIPTNSLTNALTLSGTGDGSYGALHLDYNATSSGAITLAADATISHDFNNATISNSITGIDKNLTLDNRIKGQGALTINGNISLGTGTLTKTGVNSVTLNGTNSYASALISTGALYFQSTAAMGGSGANITIQDNGVAARNGTDLDNLMLRVNTASTGAVAFGGTATTASNALNMTGYPSLSIGSMGVMAYSGTITPAGGNYRLGGGGGTLTVSSTLSGSNGLIINDAQSGTVVLTGTRSYSGATVVKNGTLRANGNLNGAVSVLSGGILAPGPASGIGSLTLDQALTVDGTLSMRIDRAATQKADLLTAPALAFNGTLAVVNIGAALQAGDSFTLFAVSGGITRNNLTLNLPTLTAGLSWNFGSLLASGTISVVATSNVIGYPDFPELLTSQLQAVKDAGYTSATINPGVYQFADGIHYQIVFTLTSWSNFTIYADNVIFIVGKQRAFVLNSCSNVKIKGLTVRARYPSATQGRVLTKGNNPDGKAYAIWKISDGYPTFAADPDYHPVANELMADFAINAVDSTTGNINQAASDTYSCILTPQGNNTWKVDFPNKTSLPFALNDWLVTRISDGQSHAIFLSGSTNCTLEAVRSQGGGFATFYEIGGGGNTIKDCTIERSPVPPAGATDLPVVSCSADGVHCRDAYPGMRVDNLTTTGVLLDDCIAIHGIFRVVTAVSGNTITVSGLGKLAVNDFVRISHDGGYFAQATCTAILDLGDGSYRLTLDQTLPVPVGARVCNPKYDGDGFRILNCHLAGTRSRAIIAKADNGVISGCTFEYCGTAVRLGSDYYWNESGYGWNVVVENNTVLNCRQGVDVHADGARGNKNITIRNNSIGTTNSYAINVEGSDGVTISGNSLAAPVNAEAMNFSDSANVTLSNNLISYAAGAKSILKGVANVTNLQGQNNGVLYSGRAYALTNALSNLLLANPASNATGDSAQQYSACNASGRWIFQPGASGYARLVSAANGLVLGSNGSSSIGAPLILESPGNGDGQLWTLKPNGSSMIELVNKLSGLTASVQTTTALETICQTTADSSTGQRWTPSFNDYNYATWRASSGASADPMADDNQNGINNLLEYALVPAASTPLTSVSIIPLTVGNQTNNYLTLSCNRRVAATDILIAVEYSSDLITWQPTAMLVNSTQNPDGTTHEVWRVPNSGNAKGFLRVRTQLAN